MSLKCYFDTWSQAVKHAYADQQWLLSKWEVMEGVRWPEEKIAAMVGTIQGGLRLSSHDFLLDLGCGGGWITERLRPVVRRAAGLDFSFPMLSVASAGGAGPWLQGDICALPFRTGSVDRVLSYFVFLNFMDDAMVERALHEVVRILRKGGIALIGQLPDRNGSLAYDMAKESYIDYCRNNMCLGERNDQGRVAPLRLFEREWFGKILMSAGVKYEFRPSFNPFYRPGCPLTVDWRFDLVLERVST